MSRERLLVPSWGTAFVYGAATVVLSGIVLLFGMVLISAVPALAQYDSTGIFTWDWNPYQEKFGILPMVAGSLALSFSALLLAWPLALSICCWIMTVPSGRASHAVRGVVRFMTAIPTVVYAFVGVILLTPFVRASFGGSGLSWLTATLVLVLLITPTIIFVLEAGLSPRLQRLCPGGLAIGLSKLDLLWFFVFPAARKTFVSAALLGFGRAIGDTLIPLMLAGNAPHAPESLIDSIRTLTAHMALVTANEVGGAAYTSLFMAGAILLGINAVVSIAARRLENSRTGQPYADSSHSAGPNPAHPRPVGRVL